MVNIHQAYFKNIGPLKNKSYVVNYKDKNVLIKAPIGTGKSFLFFDGPIFALYKSSDRTIINKDSKSGEIQLIFSIDKRYFLISRKLSITKSGKDSVKSSLYEIVADKNFFDYLNNFENIVEPNSNNILTLLKFNQIKLNDLSGEFKQESVLQQALNDLLPPKEVALSTIFLPQTSENIFEKKPAERINTLKKIFGLLGIDDSKKIIDEEKTRVYGELKARQNTDVYKDKIIGVIEKLKSLDFSIINLEELNSFLEDFKLLDLEKIDIDKLNKIDWDYEKYISKIKEIQTKYIKLKQETENIQTQINELKLHKNNLLKELEKVNLELQKLNKLSEKNNILTNKLELINKNLESMVQKYSDLQKDYENQLEIQNIISKLENDIKLLENEKSNLLKEIKNIENILTKTNNNQLNNLQKEIQSYKQQIQQIKNKINLENLTFEAKKVNSYKEALNLIIEIENQGKNYAQQIKMYETQINSLKTSIKQLENKQPTNLVYQCKLTEKTCPFVKEILTKFDNSTKVIETQKLNLLKQLKEQEELLNKILEKRNYLANWWKNNNISVVKKQLLTLQELEDNLNKVYNEYEKLQTKQNDLMKLTGKLEELKKQIKNNEIKAEQLKKQLSDYKDQLDEKIINDYKNSQKLNEEKNKLITELSSINTQLNKVVELNTKKETINLNINKIDKQIEELNEKLAKISTDLEILEKQFNLASKDEEQLSKLQQIISIYNNILDDYNLNKLEVEKIKRRYKILKDLSSIFGKELIIYVFSDYLKSLEELINYFISDIVNFTLHIQLDEKGENLDIFVEDNLGKRPVASLSGGQKTALRIGWILAISKLQKNKMLFLDETINNFDQDSVGLLANKIKEFVKSENMKFYMITHSEILQQADIWDEVVELKL